MIVQKMSTLPQTTLLRRKYVWHKQVGNAFSQTFTKST